MDNIDFKTYQKVFAERLNVLIQSRGMTARDFSIDIGLPDATIYRYLNGDRVPKIDNVIRFSIYFGVSMDWLFGLTESKTERWSDRTMSVVSRYSIATDDDRRVVETVLDKYSK